jgi:hypothetical protein
MPGNVKNIRPRPLLVLASLFLFALSCVTLYLQSVRGVVWFVPPCLRKKEYNYLLPKSVQSRNLMLQKKESKPFRISGFMRKLLSKVFFLFSRNKNDSEFSPNSLQSENFRNKNEYGEIDADSTITELSPTKEDTQEENPQHLVDDEASNNSSHSETICSICLNCVFEDSEDVEAAQEEDNDEDMLQDFSIEIFRKYSEKYRKEYVMKTPCNHLFHIGRRFGFFNWKIVC